MGIEIFIWGVRVGGLVRTPQGIAFEYDSEFIKQGLELSPINLPIAGKRIFINEADWKETEGIPGLIYDSLPDKFGNDLLRTYFMEKGLTLLQILHIGTSAGGARAKALIAINKKNGNIKSGQLPLGSEYEYYLIKIDGANQAQLEEPSGYGRLEYTYALMAKDCNIEMSECSLYNDVHFLTKRFDRDANGNKIHIHSLCGLLGLDYNKVGQYSYEHYFMAARRLNLGQNALEEIFRRMVFNVLVHNCDDHTKNFSFMMDQKGSWSLSPAFDLCYSYNNQNEWVNGHNMRVNGKRTDINYNDLMDVGKKFNIKKRETIFNKIQSIVDKFPEYANANKVIKPLVESVEKNRPRINPLN